MHEVYKKYNKVKGKKIFPRGDTPLLVHPRLGLGPYISCTVWLLLMNYENSKRKLIFKARNAHGL